MFKRGDKIHTHDGKVHRVRKDGTPKMRGAADRFRVRGFVRGALVDPDGTQHVGDWHENVITIYGHQQVVRNWAGLASASSSVAATNITQLGLAQYWAVGSLSNTTASTAFSTYTGILQTEYGSASAGAGTASRAAVSAGGGLQALSGTWTLSQTHAYAATDILHGATLNCIAQHSNISVGTASALSIAVFDSSTKGTTQALKVGRLTDALLAAA
jgi:hypothetical protein